jgi:hypothetical protein
MWHSYRSTHYEFSITANIVNGWTKDVMYRAQDRQRRNASESPTAATLFVRYLRRICHRCAGAQSM